MEAEDDGKNAIGSSDSEETNLYDLDIPRQGWRITRYLYTFGKRKDNHNTQQITTALFVSCP